MLESGDEDLDATALFSQLRVDKAALSGHIRQALQTRSQITLTELLQTRPLEQGLSELVAYLQLASESANSVVDEDTLETVEWEGKNDSLNPNTVKRRARLPRVIFVRS